MLQFDAWYLGTAAGGSWATLDDAKTAIRKALGAIPEKTRPGLCYSPPIPRSELKGPTIRIFLDGRALDATVEHDEDREPMRPWHVEPKGQTALEPARGPHATLADARRAVSAALGLKD